MKISGINNMPGTYSTQKFTPTETKNNMKTKDVVNISSTAKEYQVAKKAISQSPDIREEKVADIKRRIESGSYNLNATEIADKIVNSMFDTKV